MHKAVNCGQHHGRLDGDLTPLRERGVGRDGRAIVLVATQPRMAYVSPTMNLAYAVSVGKSGYGGTCPPCSNALAISHINAMSTWVESLGTSS